VVGGELHNSPLHNLMVDVIEMDWEKAHEKTGFSGIVKSVFFYFKLFKT
jgi:hypothetical protein